MSRDITSAVETALAGGNVPLLVFVELDFAGAAVRVSNAGWPIPWDGRTWSGLGSLGKIEPIHEPSNLEAAGVAMQLSGIPTELVSIALAEHYQGRAARIWIAPLDAGHRVKEHPVLIYVGRMDTMNLELGETATITLTTESRLADWDRPRIRRYTDADQQQRFPGDRGLEFIPQMVEKELIWGRS